MVKGRLPVSPSWSVALSDQVAAAASVVGVPHRVRAAPQLPLPSASNSSPSGSDRVATRPGPLSP